VDWAKGTGIAHHSLVSFMDPVKGPDRILAQIVQTEKGVPIVGSDLSPILNHNVLPPMTEAFVIYPTRSSRSARGKGSATSEVDHSTPIINALTASWGLCWWKKGKKWTMRQML